MRKKAVESRRQADDSGTFPGENHGKERQKNAEA